MPGDPGAAQRWRSHTPQRLNQAADQAWRKYSHNRQGQPRFDAAASQAWLHTYNEGLKKFDAEQIAPLAQAHAAWLRHPCLIQQLACNFDTADVPSGVAYTATIVDLLGPTLDKQPSYDQYVSWLSAGTFDESNRVMRVLAPTVLEKPNRDLRAPQVVADQR